MLALAWEPGTERTAVEALATPGVAHYVTGWPRAGDGGVVAEGPAGPVGAAWWRTFPPDDPGYGYVDGRTPEIAIGVRDGWRGAGIGTALLSALVERARAAGLEALSLSVAAGNPARRLYDRTGWVELWPDGGGSVTMRRTV